MKILLVEDNSSIASGLKYSLESAGYKVIIAQNYQEGVKLLNDSFALAILDITLPDGSGYDICKIAKESYQIPILFLSAKDDEDDIVKGLTLGAEDYITKPFGVKELLTRIDKILKRSMQRKVIIVDKIKLDLDKSQVFAYNDFSRAFGGLMSIGICAEPSRKILFAHI